MRGGFDKSRIYRLVYQVKDPLVLGLGLAAFRDAADFFRYETQDDAGTANPVAGGIDFAIVQGTSQSGNFSKTAIHLGFTESDSVSRRPIWDGAIPYIAARQNPINYRFAISGGEGKLYEQGTDPVLWWEPYTDTARGRATAGMLDRCRASGTCPKITEIFSAAEFWNLRMSPGHIGTRADVDIPLPPEVRRYYVPSTSHGGGNGAFTLTPAATGSTLGTCVLPANPMPAAEILRALTAATLEWVTKGREMPPSVYPKLADGTLVHETQLNFPAIPGKPSPIGLVNTIIDYDYGTNFIYNDMSGYITNGADHREAADSDVRPAGRHRRQRDRGGQAPAGPASARHVHGLEHHGQRLLQRPGVRVHRRVHPVCQDEGGTPREQRPEAVARGALWQHLRLLLAGEHASSTGWSRNVTCWPPTRIA